MLHAHVQNDWEQYLPLVFYSMYTVLQFRHQLVSHHLNLIMFGRCAYKPSIISKVAHDATSYQHQLQAKLSQLMDSVKAHNIQASS